MSIELKAALIRTLRTYIQVAGPALIALALANLSGQQPLDFAAWKVALLSGVPAVISFLWNRYLDPSSVPSLSVPVPQPPEGKP
jgi:hypothetical protein